MEFSCKWNHPGNLSKLSSQYSGKILAESSLDDAVIPEIQSIYLSIQLGIRYETYQKYH